MYGIHIPHRRRCVEGKATQSLLFYGISDRWLKFYPESWWLLRGGSGVTACPGTRRQHVGGALPGWCHDRICSFGPLPWRRGLCGRSRPLRAERLRTSTGGSVCASPVRTPTTAELAPLLDFLSQIFPSREDSPEIASGERSAWREHGSKPGGTVPVTNENKVHSTRSSSTPRTGNALSARSSDGRDDAEALENGYDALLNRTAWPPRR